MTQKDTDDLESSLLVIKLDDTPWKAMKSQSKKRRIPISTASGTSSKQRRICDPETYQSPLLHLGKTSREKTRFTSIDDSVIVLEELTSSPASDKPTLSISEDKLPVCTDDSIIILSDNEGESKTETNLGVILEDDSSGGFSELMDVTPARKLTKKKPVRHRFPFPMCCKTDFRPISSYDWDRSPEKKRSRLTRWVESNMIQSQSQAISIDSEDENTIPNDVSSRPNPHAEIITVDNSPATKTNKDIHLFATTKSVVDVNKKKDELSASTGEPSSSQPAATNGNVPYNQQPVKVNSISTTLLVKKKAAKKKSSPPFCIDKNGTHGSGGSNCYTILQIPQPLQKKDQTLAVKQLQNPNWAAAAKNGITKNVPAKRPSYLFETPRTNVIRSYYTQEIIPKVPGSLREIVIDGCNVAMAYTNGNSFSEVGLKMVIDYFMLRGHSVKVFIPQHVRSWQHKVLESLHTEGIVVFTPSRRAGNKHITSYDDRYILDYATLCNGIVVTRDQFRDLYGEKWEWREVIENRLLVPTFAGKTLMFPEDPLGRGGPSLEEFLKH